MIQVGIRRAMIESLVRSTRYEAASSKRSVKTIDPIMKVGRKMYPYISDRELVDYASIALRIILNSRESYPHQTTLVTY